MMHIDSNTHYIRRDDGMILCYKGSSSDLGFFPAGTYAAATFSYYAAMEMVANLRNLFSNHKIYATLCNKSE